MQIVRNYGIIMKLEFSRGGKTILTPLPLLPNFRRKEPTMSENQNKLILLKDLGKKQHGAQGRSLRVALVECPICKKHYETSYYHAVSGKITKCKGCATTIMKTTHGLRQHILYAVFSTMKTRTRANINYRERGITVCKEWKNDFKAFYDWSMENGYKEGLSIDRIDNNGNYEPSNCRWTTKDIQNRNTRVLRSTNTSGYRGVSFFKKDNKWGTIITVNYKRKYLGSFETALEAAKAYDNYVIENNLEHTINNV